ncbi:MAG: AAA family ATPase [Arcobacter sp.]|uniref:AAA family ATPase n=1 Tax=Arcobacter sp. TaxID=1872629 RepID=UPI003D072249
MELVYLWVKNYKNIVEQGFNFSPRFRCEYDEEKNELEIIDKEETGEFYPKKFFGDNINVTAIVGENGSGKSSVIKKLSSQLIYDCINNIYAKYNNCIIIFRKNEELFCLENYKYPIRCNKNIIKDDNYYVQNLGYLEMNLFTYFYDSLNKKPDSLKELVYFISDIKHKDYFGNYFTPDMVVFIQKDRGPFITTGNNFLDDFIKYICEFLMKKLNIGECSNISEFFGKIEEKFESEKPKYPLFKERKIYTYLEKILEIKNDLESLFIQDPLKNDKTTYVININKISTNIDKYFFILSDLPDECFDINFIDTRKNLEYSSLSQGEKEILNIRFKIVNELNESRKVNNLILFDEPTNSFHPQWQKNFLKYLVDVFSDKNIHFIFTSHSPFLLSDLPKENVIFLEKDEKTGNCINATTKVDITPFGANIHTLLSHGFFMKNGLIGEFAKEKINSIISYHEKLLKKELTKNENKKQRDEEKVIYEKEHKTKFRQIQSIIGDDYLKQVIKNHLVEIEKILYDEYLIDKEIKKLEDEIERLKRLKK